MPNYLKALISISCIASVFFLTGYGGSSSDSGSTTGEPSTTSIYGQVTDESGLGISGVSVYTNPDDMGRATTDSSGNYTLSDNEGEKTEYRVYAEKAGYTSSNSFVSVAIGSSNRVDLQLNSDGNGLVTTDNNGVETDGVKIDEDETTATFLLTGTTDNNTFSFSTTANWLSISPQSGQIDTKTTEIIEVSVNKSLLTNGTHTATIIGNGNTSQDARIGVVVGVSEKLPKGEVVVDDKTGEVRIDDSDDTPDTTPLGTVSKEGFDIVLESCSYSSSELDCALSVTLTGSPTTLWLECGTFGTALIDDAGAAYSADQAALGGDVDIPVAAAECNQISRSLA